MKRRGQSGFEYILAFTVIVAALLATDFITNARSPLRAYFFRAAGRMVRMGVGL